MAEVAAIYGRYLFFPDRGTEDEGVHEVVLALWTAHTYAIEGCHYTPYLHVTSAEMRSGKSRLLDVASTLVKVPLAIADISAAALYTAIDQLHPTLLVDEVDALFGRQGSDFAECLRGVLNAGFERGRPAMRVQMTGKSRELVFFDVFGPKLLSGIRELPATIADRAIRIELVRAGATDTVERLDKQKLLPGNEALRLALESEMGVRVAEMLDSEPERPEGLDDRAYDIWRPLLTIANMAGGKWPQMATAAALVLSGSARRAISDSEGISLLRDIRKVLEDADRDDVVSSLQLVQALCELGGRWGQEWGQLALSERRGDQTKAGSSLAVALKPFGLTPKLLHHEGTRFRGYTVSDFEYAWDRWLRAA